MDDSLNHLLDQTLETAAVGIFESLGVPVELETEEGTTTHEMACAIGFASATLRGSLTLTGDRAMLDACRPRELRGSAATLAEMSDWLGELGNQMLGRFKNRLIGHGIVVELGTPAVLVGVQIRQQPAAQALGCFRYLRAQGGTLMISVNAHATPDFQFSEAHVESEVLPEGGLSLF